MDRLTGRDISDAVTAEGFTVERNQVAINDPIKSLGLFDVRVILHPEVSVNVKVNVARSLEEAQMQAQRGGMVTAAELLAEEEEAEALPLPPLRKRTRKTRTPDRPAFRISSSSPNEKAPAVAAGAFFSVPAIIWDISSSAVPQADIGTYCIGLRRGLRGLVGSGDVKHQGAQDDPDDQPGDSAKVTAVLRIRRISRSSYFIKASQQLSDQQGGRSEVAISLMTRF